MAKIRLSGVTKKFGDQTVVDGLDLDIEEGRFTVLVGPSGCGKTTTLRMIAGLEEVSSGSIVIGDKDVTTVEPRYRDVAMVFQNYALYANLSVAKNMAFPLKARHLPKAEIDRRVHEAAESLGLLPLMDRVPGQLSGGQQQRVAIGRAIVREPSAFLFDEPLSNLDAKLRVEMRTELLRLQKRIQATCVYVTHDQEEAMTLSDRVVVMNEGRIAQSGAPTEVYDRPKNAFVAAFLGSPSMNLVRGAVSDGTFKSAEGNLNLEVEAPIGEVLLGVRPEDLLVTTNAVGATVEIVEMLGPRAIVTCDAGGITLTAVIEAAAMSGVVEGERVGLAVRPGALHLFDPVSGNRR